MKFKHFFLLAFFAIVTATQSQTIPNADFEIWNNTSGYNQPDSWSTLNKYTSAASVYTCLKGSPGSKGAAYMKLISKNVSGIGVVPGMALCGTIDEVSFAPKSGFAYSYRPSNFVGKYQYMGGNSKDIGYMRVILTKWNQQTQSRDTIAIANKNLTGMEMSWASFSMPMNYTSNDMPDSCMIILSASGNTPVANSYLYVDDLAFTGISSDISNDDMMRKILVYPNPSNDELKFDFQEQKINQIRIFDLMGNLIKNLSQEEIQANQIDISSFPKGTYLFQIDSNSKFVSQKFTK